MDDKKGITIGITGSGKAGLYGESPIKKIIEILDRDNKKISETDLVIKDPSPKEIQEDKIRKIQEKRDLEYRIREKLQSAMIVTKKNKDLKKKNKRKMVKKSRKRNRK